MGIGGFLKKAIGIGADAVPGGAAIKTVIGLVKDYAETPAQKRAAAAVAAKMENDMARLQLAVNQAEAKHRSVWVAGWRPYIGWGLGTVLIALGCASAYRILIGEAAPDLAPMAPFFYTIGSMLGLGAGLRTLEKQQGVAR